MDSSFRLTNQQRKIWGISPVETTWKSKVLNGGPHRSYDLLVYFDKDVIKKVIISTDTEYQEMDYDEATLDKDYLLPKTQKGKPKKLSATTILERKPKGMGFHYHDGYLKITNHETTHTWYNSLLAGVSLPTIDELQAWIRNSSQELKKDYYIDLKVFLNAKRKKVRAKSGDFFVFKLDMNTYGYGRILAHVFELREREQLPENHGLWNVLGVPLLVAIYAFTSNERDVPVKTLKQQLLLPSCYIFDNPVLRGDYAVIGNDPLKQGEIDFPINYGLSTLRERTITTLQCGVVQSELPSTKFDKFLKNDTAGITDSPFRFEHVSFGVHTQLEMPIIKACHNTSSLSPYWEQENYFVEHDLRNPKNSGVLSELLSVFQFDLVHVRHQNFQALQNI